MPSGGAIDIEARNGKRRTQQGSRTPRKRGQGASFCRRTSRQGRPRQRQATGGYGETALANGTPAYRPSALQESAAEIIDNRPGESRAYFVRLISYGRNETALDNPGRASNRASCRVSDAAKSALLGTPQAQKLFKKPAGRNNSKPPVCKAARLHGLHQSY